MPSVPQPTVSDADAVCSVCSGSVTIEEFVVQADTVAKIWQNTSLPSAVVLRDTRGNIRRVICLTCVDALLALVGG